MRNIWRWMIILAVPVVLTIGTARLLTLPWYPAWAYQRADFPPDPLGMPLAERLVLARASIAYLNLPWGQADLGALWLPDGTPAFNAREIQHMVDVKAVYGVLTWCAVGMLALAGGATWALARQGARATLWGALSDGGLLTLFILLALGVWMLVGFEQFFTAFHLVFFKGDSWLFPTTDTLIRLFPLPFWEMAGYIIAGVVGTLGFGLALVGRAMQRRLERATAAQNIPQTTATEGFNDDSHTGLD